MGFVDKIRYLIELYKAKRDIRKVKTWKEVHKVVK